MTPDDRIYCFEPFDVTDPLVRAAERLYLQTQHPDERIPWGWIARSIKGRIGWRPGSPGKHLLVATPGAADRGALAGFAYGSHIPGYGGYLCYIGVADPYRKRGVGTRLFNQLFKVLSTDAGAADESLPFVVWESRRPEPDAPDADWKLWDARVRLFDKVGGHWIEGLELLTPNYGSEDDLQPIPLQLFVRPLDLPASAFDAERLRGIAAGLLEQIYRAKPGDAHYDRTLEGAVDPRLRPAREAGRRKEERMLAAV